MMGSSRGQLSVSLAGRAFVWLARRVTVLCVADAYPETRCLSHRVLLGFVSYVGSRASFVFVRATWLTGPGGCRSC